MVYRGILFILIFMVSSYANIDFEKIKSFSADFIQTVTNESGKKVQYKGLIFVKSSGKVLWKYSLPIVKNVYILNKRVIIDEPELEQVIYTTLKKGIDLVNLLKSAKKIEKNLYSTKLYDIDYFIKVKNNKIEKIYFKDELSNNIEIEFLNIKENQNIDETVFLFTLPENYDVIEK